TMIGVEGGRDAADVPARLALAPDRLPQRQSGLDRRRSGRRSAMSAGWYEVRQTVAEVWQEMRADQQPLPVLYLLCAGGPRVPPRPSVKKSFGGRPRGGAFFGRGSAR